MGSEAAAYDNDFEEIKDEEIKDEKSRGPPEEKYAEDFEEEEGEEGAWHIKKGGEKGKKEGEGGLWLMGTAPAV